MLLVPFCGLLPILKYVTCFDNARWIDRHVSFVDVADNAFFIDQESGAIAKALLFVEDAISLDHCAFEIAEDRKGYFDLFCKFAVGGNAVYTHSEDLSVGCIEFGDISLIRLQFLRSTTGECKHINRQYDILLAFEVAKFITLSIGGSKCKIRSRVTDLQVCFGWSWLLGHCDNAKHCE